MKKSVLNKILLTSLATVTLAGCSSSTTSTPAATADSSLVDTSGLYPIMDVSNGIPEGVSGRLAAIKEAGVLTVATEPYWVPNEFIDPTATSEEDKYIGSDIEFAKYIAEKMGVELQIVPLEFSAVLAAIPEGKYDLAISALAYTPARAEAMELSEGYYFSEDNKGYGLLIPVELADEILTADDLGDYTIITQSGSIQEVMVNTQVDSYKEFKRVSSMTDAYLAVQEGKADCAIVAKASAQIYIDANPNCGLMVVEDFKFTLGPEYDGTRVGAKKGEIELIAFVNGCIEELLAEGTYSEWYDYYVEYAKTLGVE